MLGVTIYHLRDGQDEKVGSIRLVDGVLRADPPDNPLLQKILATPVSGNKFNPRPVSATENPMQFLTNLPYFYRGAYLRASHPHEIAP